MKYYGLILISFLLAGCGSMPDGIKAVSNFELNRYMGTWYEIARFDHRFERGMQQVSATYSLNDDGSVKVLNRGYQTKNNTWEDAIGKAKFSADKTTGHLKVSFFGPFYGDYLIFDLDEENYQYSFVTGGEDYLWLLSRTPEVSADVKAKFIEQAQALGYNTDALIFVDQSKSN